MVKMVHFGFSYVGLLYLAMLFIPNMLWAKCPPDGYAQYEKNESRLLRILERTGQVLVCTCAVCFSDFNVRKTYWAVWLGLSFAAMVLYEAYWVRYFKSPHTMKDMLSSLLGIPVAGASLPVISFALLGVYGCNPFLLIAVAILGIGHIGIHLQHRNEVWGSL